jgi:hypothetical protein
MMLFIYGVKATWLLWVWPLFNVVFRMMYLGTWVRRSNVLKWHWWRFNGYGLSLAGSFLSNYTDTLLSSQPASQPARGEP